jgi:hypothetical protein
MLAIPEKDKTNFSAIAKAYAASTFDDILKGKGCGFLVMLQLVKSSQLN